jgi:hypothetical protein
MSEILVASQKSRAPTKPYRKIILQQIRKHLRQMEEHQRQMRETLHELDEHLRRLQNEGQRAKDSSF